MSAINTDVQSAKIMTAECDWRGGRLHWILIDATEKQRTKQAGAIEASVSVTIEKDLQNPYNMTWWRMDWFASARVFSDENPYAETLISHHASAFKHNRDHCRSAHAPLHPAASVLGQALYTRLGNTAILNSGINNMHWIKDVVLIW